MQHACPAMTELEVVVVDWLAQLLHLPEAFLFHRSHSSAAGAGDANSTYECWLVKDRLS